MGWGLLELRVTQRLIKKTEKIEHKRLPWTWADVCGQSKTCFTKIKQAFGFFVLLNLETACVDLNSQTNIYTHNYGAVTVVASGLRDCLLFLDMKAAKMANSAFKQEMSVWARFCLFYISRWRMSVCLFVSLLIQITGKTHVEPSNYFSSFSTAAAS